jgi:hypothetical protein
MHIGLSPSSWPLSVAALACISSAGPTLYLGSCRATRTTYKIPFIRAYRQRQHFSSSICPSSGNNSVPSGMSCAPFSRSQQQLLFSASAPTQQRAPASLSDLWQHQRLSLSQGRVAASVHIFNSSDLLSCLSAAAFREFHQGGNSNRTFRHQPRPRSNFEALAPLCIVQQHATCACVSAPMINSIVSAAAQATSALYSSSSS